MKNSPLIFSGCLIDFDIISKNVSYNPIDSDDTSSKGDIQV